MCDTLCALAPATVAGRTLFAKNSDRPPTEPQRLEWHPARGDEQTTTTTYLEIEAHAGSTLGFVGSRPQWSWGVEHGVNEAGVAIGNEAVWTTLDPNPFPAALIGMDLVRLGLERAATASDAVDIMTTLLERHGQGGACHPEGRSPYWSSFLVADPAAAFVVETSGREWAVEAVERTRAISNQLTIPAFRAQHHLETGGTIERRVDPRVDAGDGLLAAGAVDVAAVQAHLRSHTGNDGYSVCMHVPGGDGTTASIVALLGDGDGAGSRCWCLLGPPCRSLYVPLWVGRPLGTPPAWERFAGLTDTHTDAVRALEADLAAAAADDDAWAPEAWRRVDALLTTLGL